MAIKRGYELRWRSLPSGDARLPAAAMQDQYRDCATQDQARRLARQLLGLQLSIAVSAYRFVELADGARQYFEGFDL